MGQIRFSSTNRGWICYDETGGSFYLSSGSVYEVDNLADHSLALIY